MVSAAHARVCARGARRLAIPLEPPGERRCHHSQAGQPAKFDDEFSARPVPRAGNDVPGAAGRRCFFRGSKESRPETRALAENEFVDRLDYECVRVGKACQWKLASVAPPTIRAL